MSLLIFIRRQAIGVFAVGQGLLLGSAMILTASGCGERYIPLSAKNSARSTEAILPVELGEPSSMVLSRLRCLGREVVQGKVICPHEPLVSDPDEWGRLEVFFAHGRAEQVMWAQDRDDVPVEQISALRDFLRSQWSDPMYSNHDPDDESLESALERGEWHERWHLRSGLLITYFAQINDAERKKYQWVVVSKRGGAQSS